MIGGGHAIALPAELDPKAIFGTVCARVVARVADVEYRTTLMRYSGVDYLEGVEMLRAKVRHP